MEQQDETRTLPLILQTKKGAASKTGEMKRPAIKVTVVKSCFIVPNAYQNCSRMTIIPKNLDLLQTSTQLRPFFIEGIANSCRASSVLAGWCTDFTQRSTVTGRTLDESIGNANEAVSAHHLIETHRTRISYLGRVWRVGGFTKSMESKKRSAGGGVSVHPNRASLRIPEATKCRAGICFGGTESVIAIVG